MTENNTVKESKVSKIYNYTFHFNDQKANGVWAAIPRGKEVDYFNNMTDRVNTGVLFSEDIKTLIEFLS